MLLFSPNTILETLQGLFQAEYVTFAPNDMWFTSQQIIVETIHLHFYFFSGFTAFSFFQC